MDAQTDVQPKDNTPGQEPVAASQAPDVAKVDGQKAIAVAAPNGGAAANPPFVERSPHGNYVKFPDVLGKGAFKTVYKGQDVNNGNLVAWNEVNIKSYGKKERARIMNEIMLLRTLSHPNLISFYGGWVNKDAEKVAFVTELMSSGTLKEFTAKYPIPLKQIKRYAREILECIQYLHTPGQPDAVPAGGPQGADGEAAAKRTPKPAVIHRDLKCDNIFIMNQGKGIKIGDLGLATTDGRSIMGTPEFMAPEMYETGYSTSVDVYAFGLCLLEMVTGRTPYVECGNVVAIYKRVLAGVLPENIRVLEAGWPEAYAFVLRCLQPLPEPADAGLAAVAEGDEDEDEGDETETEGAGPSKPVAAPSATVSSKSVQSSEAEAGSASSNEPKADTPHTAPAAGGAAAAATAPQADDGPRPDGNGHLRVPKRSGQRVAYRRPTAAELLQDAFLTVKDEDATRTTLDVRKAAEAKGVFLVSGPEDPNRKPELPQLQLHQASKADSATAASALAMAVQGPSVPVPAGSAVSSAVDQQVAAASTAPVSAQQMPITSTDNDPVLQTASGGTSLQSASATGAANSSNVQVPVPDRPASATDSVVRTTTDQRQLRPSSERRANESSRRSRQASATATQSVPSVQALAEEVRTLRAWVAQTYGLVEWLVLQQEGGKQFIESRTGRKISQKASASAAEAQHGVSEQDSALSSRKSKAKSVSFADSVFSQSADAEPSPSAAGGDAGIDAHPPGNVLLKQCEISSSVSTPAQSSPLAASEPSAFTIESVLSEFDANGTDMFFSESSDGSGLSMTQINKLRFDERREEYKIAKISAKQLQDLTEARARSQVEHDEASLHENERHQKEVDAFEKSRVEILKVLGPLRVKKERSDTAADVEASADEDGLTLRERTEEQMYSRRLELLVGREDDERRRHAESIRSIGETFERNYKRFASREKEIRDQFLSRVEKLRLELSLASQRLRDGASAADAPATSDAGDRTNLSPVPNGDVLAGVSSSGFAPASPQLLFFATVKDGESGADRKPEVTGSSPRDGSKTVSHTSPQSSQLAPQSGAAGQDQKDAVP